MHQGALYVFHFGQTCRIPIDGIDISSGSDHGFTHPKGSGINSKVQKLIGETTKSLTISKMADQKKDKEDSFQFQYKFATNIGK
jgi:hypothetical protein